VHAGEIADSMLVLFSDEAWFHLSECMNSQRNSYWSAENPMLSHEVPLHDGRVCFKCN
jgi:hypothetical protein